jgi:hypothetical protein
MFSSSFLKSLFFCEHAKRRKSVILFLCFSSLEVTRSKCEVLNKDRQVASWAKIKKGYVLPFPSFSFLLTPLQQYSYSESASSEDEGKQLTPPKVKHKSHHRSYFGYGFRPEDSPRLRIETPQQVTTVECLVQTNANY